MQETRDNQVTLHDDDEEVLDWLLETIKNDGDNADLIGILPGRRYGDLDMPVDENGDDLISVAYALILKYDCPDFMSILANGFVVTIRFLASGYELREFHSFIKKHIEFITEHTDGRYPVGLAPAIAEAWICLQKLPGWDESLEMEPPIYGLINSEPGLAMAVAKCYQAQLIRAEASVETIRDIFRKPKWPAMG